MQSLQEKASQWSGVKAEDAFSIDETNLFQKLGLQTFINLSTDFYTRVYDDDEEWFRSIFANSKKEDAIQNQYEFFVQRMGGPPLYSQRKGKRKKNSLFYILMAEKLDGNFCFHLIMQLWLCGSRCPHNLILMGLFCFTTWYRNYVKP
ncbi:hypothetical protein MKW94_020622 [Papaver nudicaule]|uniref:Uncharacterized protein n=1 Tax=Papaver nudicaule TaxID=74823 RepID=A0AA41S4F1_PAPNU|nr:hypothetical protein [Papaver nudicaule]